ncbi:MAG: thymidylate kinase [Anaerolineales bacterium]|nr:thymidylate kinase [Anaerolineales bacterium]
MTQVLYYGHPLPGLADTRLPGKLIVVEGTDGVGRSTQIALLREWLEANGFAATETGLTRSELAAAGLKKAKRGHTMGDLTMNLFYATDFVDRLEKQIVPALRAGFVVLTDRYIYSLIARAQVRGVDPQWIRDVLGFALIPDAVFYLKIDIDHLLPRVINSRGFDYWESGTDYLRGDDLYENYVRHQTLLIEQFDAMATEYQFHVVDATRNVPEVFGDLRAAISTIVADMQAPAESGVSRRRTRRRRSPAGAGRDRSGGPRGLVATSQADTQQPGATTQGARG